MKMAAVYARYSSEKQSEQSIEGQLTECHKFAEQNGLHIVETYIDRAMTGTNDNRTAFQQMLADSGKSVAWDIVLVYALDRFGRNSIEVAVNKQKLKKNNKVLISATQRTSENIDGSKNLDGILLENVYIGLAEYYSAELSQKVRRGMHESRIKGLWGGGILPYGYYAENKRLYIKEDEAAVIRFMYQQYAQGKIIKEIIQELSDKGIYFKGKPFIEGTVAKMLKYEKYTGRAHYEGKVFDNIYPQIIPIPLFETVQARLALNKIGSRSSKVDYLLKSKIQCGLCGRPICGESGTTKKGVTFYYYKCIGRKKYHSCDKGSYPKTELENLILDTTINLLVNSETTDFIATEIMKILEKRMTDKTLLNVLLAERAALQKSLNNLLNAIEQGLITSTTKNRMEELESKIAELNEKIAIEECKEKNKITKEQIIKYFEKTIKLQPIQIITTLIQKIIAYDDRLEIYYNYIENMPEPPPQDYSLEPCSNLNNSVAPKKT